MKQIEAPWIANYDRHRNAYYNLTDEPMSSLPGYDPGRCIWRYCEGYCEKCEENEDARL